MPALIILTLPFIGYTLNSDEQPERYLRVPSDGHREKILSPTGDVDSEVVESIQSNPGLLKHYQNSGPSFDSRWPGETAKCDLKIEVWRGLAVKQDLRGEAEEVLKCLEGASIKKHPITR